MLHENYLNLFTSYKIISCCPQCELLLCLFSSLFHEYGQNLTPLFFLISQYSFLFFSVVHYNHIKLLCLDTDPVNFWLLLAYLVQMRCKTSIVVLEVFPVIPKYMKRTVSLKKMIVGTHDFEFCFGLRGSWVLLIWKKRKIRHYDVFVQHKH